MLAQFSYLSIEGGFGDFAFLDIDYQSIVGAYETDVKALFEFVPLAANHDAVAITIGFRTGNDFGDKAGIQAAEPGKSVSDLLVFELQLCCVGQVLVLATATVTKVRAGRLDSLGRRLENPNQFCTGEPLLDLTDFGLHFFTESDKRDENDEIFNSRDPLTAKGDIAN